MDVVRPDPLPLGTPYQTLDEALTALSTLEQHLRERRDRRAIFITAYLVITAEIRRRIVEGGFADNAWVSNYAVCFANLYRQALVDFENGNTAAVPKSWRISFQTSKDNSALVIHDLMLGINAHINHDLALALTEVTIDPERQQRYADHTLVNQALKAATDLLQERICRTYAPVLELLDFAGGALDEELANFSVAKARESAWVSAVALANARNDAERAVIRAALNDRAGVMARLIMSPMPRQRWVVEALHHVESLNPWWLALPPLITSKCETQQGPAC